MGPSTPASGSSPDLPDERALADETLKASRALLAVVARSLADTLERVTLPQFRVLVVLSSTGPQRSGVLADRLGVHPSTLTRIVDRMVAGGWVERSGNPESRREVVIGLTAAGKRVVGSVTRRRHRDIAEILAAVPAEQRPLVLEGMRAFALAAGEPSATDLLTLGV